MMTNEHDNDGTLPAALVERLKARDRSVAMLTPQVDRNIEKMAAEQFAQRPVAQSYEASRHTRRRGVPVWGIGAAAAAALAFVVVIVRQPQSLIDAEPVASVPTVAAPAVEAPATFGAAADASVRERAAVAGDYDASGTLDVLDAWRLSRDLAANPQFAANDTVASLMQRIVSLDGGAP